METHPTCSLRDKTVSRIVYGPQTPRHDGKKTVQMSPKTIRGPPQRMGKCPRYDTNRPSHHVDEALRTHNPLEAIPNRLPINGSVQP